VEAEAQKFCLQQFQVDQAAVRRAYQLEQMQAVQLLKAAEQVTQVMETPEEAH
jgi:hypothetical protein